MDLPIKNVDDLREEIYRLKGLEKEQSVALGLRFKNPLAVLSTLISLFPKSANTNNTQSSSFFDQDLVGLISRFILPLTLNKTLFRNSSFIVKTIVGLISQKASHFITEDSIAVLWEKVSTLFKNKTKNDTPSHKGVPPLSETY